MKTKNLIIIAVQVAIIAMILILWNSGIISLFTANVMNMALAIICIILHNTNFNQPIVKEK